MLPRTSSVAIRIELTMDNGLWRQLKLNSHSYDASELVCTVRRQQLGAFCSSAHFNFEWDKSSLSLWSFLSNTYWAQPINHFAFVEENKLIYTQTSAVFFMKNSESDDEKSERSGDAEGKASQVSHTMDISINESMLT